MSNSAYLKTDTHGGETKFFPQRTSRNFSKASKNNSSNNYRLPQRTDIPNSSPAKTIQLTPNNDKKLQCKEDIRSKQQGTAVQKKDDNPIKGEIGLHEGTATKNNGAVTVDGKTKDGENIRGAHYNTEVQYDRSEAQITDIQNHIATSKTEAKSLIDLYSKIGEAVGEVHLKFLFSSMHFIKQQNE